MKKLKFFNELFCMACSSALNSGEQLVPELFTYVGVDKDATNTSAADG